MPKTSKAIVTITTERTGDRVKYTVGTEFDPPITGDTQTHDAGVAAMEMLQAWRQEKGQD